MKQAVITRAALLGASAGFLALALMRPDGLSPASDREPAERRLPSKATRKDDDHHPDRFAALDAATRDIARRFEAAAISWTRERPPWESAHRTQVEWDRFADSLVSSLETPRIRALQEWMSDRENPYVSELRDYRQSLMRVRSSREPSIVRQELMERLRDLGPAPEDSPFSITTAHTWLADDFHHHRAGHARADPMAAWGQFLADAADPAMEDCVDAGTSLPVIFREFAAARPETVWEMALSGQHGRYAGLMIEGFADGAPPGQPWADLAHALEQLDFPDHAFTAFAERWVMEEATAAFDWYVRTAPPDRILDEESFDPELPEWSPSEMEKALGRHLVWSLYDSHKDRMSQAVGAMAQLAADEQHAGFAAELVGEMLEKSFHLMDTPLLGVIPAFSSRETRHDLFLLAVENLPVQEHPWGPNPAVESLRDLTRKLELPAEISARAGAAILRVEAAEEAARRSPDR